MSQMQETIEKTVDSMAEELLRLSHDIHDHPELGLQEKYAVERITSLLREHGYEPEIGLGSLDTAFRISRKGKGPGPNVAILAEYDALPEVGHG